jgi:hypothetical protein
MPRPKNTSNDAIVAQRRRRVAALRLRGLSQREIQAELAKEGEGQLINPKTDEPYALMTINRDVLSLEAEWKQDAISDIAQHKGRNLAETREARRVAWAKEKLYYVFRGLEHEANLLGLFENSDSSPLKSLEELAHSWGSGMESEGTLEPTEGGVRGTP